MSRLRNIVTALRTGIGFVTPLGWTVAVIAVLTWVFGAWFNWSELMIMAAASIVLVILAIVFTLGRLDLDANISVEPARVVVGDRAAGELALTNKRTRTARGLRVEMPVGKALAVFSIPALKADTTTDELFVVPTHKRAIIPVGPLITVQGDPVGLMRREQRWSDVEEIYVHPKTSALSTIAAGQIRDMEGQTTSALSPSDVAFHTLREYVRGDDLRHVHWKSSAKIGELMVRQYNDTRRSHIAVVLSVDPDEYASEDECELAISCAASVAVQAMRDDQTLTVLVGGDQFPTVNPTRLLDRFSGIELTPGVGGLDDAVKLMRRVAPDASVGVLCVGSGLDIPAIRGATLRAGLDMGTVVLQADFAGEPGYRSVGDSTFVTVPELDALNRGLGAVIGA